MASKTYLGIDIGHSMLKLALVSKGIIRKTVLKEMPEKLMIDGRIVSIEAMGELIRTTMKENGIRARDAALILSAGQAYVKNAVLPRMTEEQLRVNLPYEFRDYISEDLKQYTYDYAMLSYPGESVRSDTEEEASDRNMEVLAAAIQTELLESLRSMVRKAGLKLAKAAPEVSAYMPLIRAERRRQGIPETSYEDEYCILDVGYRAIRMYMFRGDRLQVTRSLENGLDHVAGAIAEFYNVDEHLGHTYMITDHDNCLEKEAAQNVFSNIAIELMRAVNFYRFSNPDSQLTDLWMCGGGARIPGLVQQIRETLDLNIYNGADLLPANPASDDAVMFVQACGIAMDD